MPRDLDLHNLTQEKEEVMLSFGPPPLDNFHTIEYTFLNFCTVTGSRYSGGGGGEDIYFRFRF